MWIRTRAYTIVVICLMMNFLMAIIGHTLHPLQ